MSLLRDVLCCFCKTPIKTVQNSQHFPAIGYAHKECPTFDGDMSSSPPVEDDDIPPPSMRVGL